MVTNISSLADFELGWCNFFLKYLKSSAVEAIWTWSFLCGVVF